MSATPAMTPIALFMAPLMPLMELLLIAKMRPLRSGRAFQRFWKALAWVATSFINVAAWFCSSNIFEGGNSLKP